MVVLLELVARWSALPRRASRKRRRLDGCTGLPRRRHPVNAVAGVQETQHERIVDAAAYAEMLESSHATTWDRAFGGDPRTVYWLEAAGDRSSRH
jgi:hypothetical protein